MLITSIRFTYFMLTDQIRFAFCLWISTIIIEVQDVQISSNEAWQFEKLSHIWDPFQCVTQMISGEEMNVKWLYLDCFDSIRLAQNFSAQKIRFTLLRLQQRNIVDFSNKLDKDRWSILDELTTNRLNRFVVC